MPRIEDLPSQEVYLESFRVMSTDMSVFCNGLNDGLVDFRVQFEEVKINEITVAVVGHGLSALIGKLVDFGQENEYQKNQFDGVSKKNRTTSQIVNSVFVGEGITNFESVVSTVAKIAGGGFVFEGGASSAHIDGGSRSKCNPDEFELRFWYGNRGSMQCRLAITEDPLSMYTMSGQSPLNGRFVASSKRQIIMDASANTQLELPEGSGIFFPGGISWSERRLIECPGIEHKFIPLTRPRQSYANAITVKRVIS
jgi:hypothetical protein